MVQIKVICAFITYSERILKINGAIYTKYKTFHFFHRQFFSEPFTSSGGHCSQRAVHFRGRTAENQITQGSLCDLDILEGSHDMDLGVCQHDSAFRRVFDGEFRPSAFARDSADRSRQMVTLKEKSHQIYTL